MIALNSYVFRRKKPIDKTLQMSKSNYIPKFSSKSGFQNISDKYERGIQLKLYIE